MGSVFNGGKKARQEAQRQQQLAREEQQVANNRQLAELNRSSERAVLSRRNPRGRRLFSDSANNNLPGTLS